MAQQSNVLLITADQWRGDCLSALDHATVKTPALDALAGDGVLFRQHFSQCVPCGPSRASLFTGMYLMNHRSVGNGTPLDARFTNLALELRRGGYDPALIGYTDTSLDPRQHHANDPVLTTYASVLPGFRQLVPGSEHMPAWLGHLRRQGYTIPTPAKDIYRPITNDPAASGRGPTYPPACYRAEDSDTAFSPIGRSTSSVHRTTRPGASTSACCGRIRPSLPRHPTTRSITPTTCRAFAAHRARRTKPRNTPTPATRFGTSASSRAWSPRYIPQTRRLPVSSGRRTTV